jgi:predicted NBD/HSP70 family sugar kinase
MGDASGSGDMVAGVDLGGSENIPAMLGRSPSAYLREKLGAPAWVDNDATCAAAAELAYGAGRGLNSFLLVTVGTGIGGGLVLGGRVWRGVRGFAGEIGHVSLDPRGHPCPCGSRGCLEQYASGPAIVRAWKERAGSRAETAASPLEVARLARRGDPAALAAFAAAGRAVGQALGAAVNLLDIEALLIGGGVAEGVRVIAAKFGNDAGLVGAAALAWERLGA